MSNSEYKIIVCLDEFENVVNENDIEIFFKPNIYQIFNGNLSRDIKLWKLWDSSEVGSLFEISGWEIQRESKHQSIP